MREVLAVVCLHLGQALADLGVGAAVERVGGEQLFGEGDGAVDALHDALACGAEGVGMFAHQVAHGGEGGPAGLGVVAEVEHAADLELAADERRPSPGGCRR